MVFLWRYEGFPLSSGGASTAGRTFGVAAPTIGGRISTRSSADDFFVKKFPTQKNPVKKITQQNVNLLVNPWVFLAEKTSTQNQVPRRSLSMEEVDLLLLLGPEPWRAYARGESGLHASVWDQTQGQTEEILRGLRREFAGSGRWESSWIIACGGLESIGLELQNSWNKYEKMGEVCG